MSQQRNYELAKVAYEAYGHSSGGKSLITGEPLPAFSVLKPEIQEAWYCAAAAVERVTSAQTKTA